MHTGRRLPTQTATKLTAPKNLDEVEIEGPLNHANPDEMLSSFQIGLLVAETATPGRGRVRRERGQRETEKKEELSFSGFRHGTTRPRVTTSHGILAKTFERASVFDVVYHLVRAVDRPSNERIQEAMIPRRGKTTNSKQRGKKTAAGSRKAKRL